MKSVQDWCLDPLPGDPALAVGSNDVLHCSGLMLHISIPVSTFFFILVTTCRLQRTQKSLRILTSPQQGQAAVSQSHLLLSGGEKE
ncbi:hypothetical protein AGIG_G4919 [Arapaima gigas]